MRDVSVFLPWLDAPPFGKIQVEGMTLVLEVDNERRPIGTVKTLINRSDAGITVIAETDDDAFNSYNPESIRLSAAEPTPIVVVVEIPE